MPVERAKVISDLIYHHMYGFLQSHNFLGAWKRCRYQHIASIREYLLSNKNISILYCGTATAENPSDVSSFVQTLDVSVPKIFRH